MTATELAKEVVPSGAERRRRGFRVCMRRERRVRRGRGGEGEGAGEGAEGAEGSDEGV